MTYEKTCITESNQDFKVLIGQTIKKFQINEDKDIITIKTGFRHYQMLHRYDCCENVSVKDICGDIEDILNEKIILAEEVISNDIQKGQIIDEDSEDSFTWTFYKLGTNKGSITISWYGESNGYYSESVDFIEQYGHFISQELYEYYCNQRKTINELTMDMSLPINELNQKLEQYKKSLSTICEDHVDNLKLLLEIDNIKELKQVIREIIKEELGDE